MAKRGKFTSICDECGELFETNKAMDKLCADCNSRRKAERRDTRLPSEQGAESCAIFGEAIMSGLEISSVEEADGVDFYGRRLDYVQAGFGGMDVDIDEGDGDG